MLSKYTNKEAISLAQCAYFNFTNKEIEDYQDDPAHIGFPTVRDLLVAIHDYFYELFQRSNQAN